MADPVPGKGAGPLPAKPQSVIAEQPLPNAQEALASNAVSSTFVTDSNDRSVSNIHTGGKTEYDPTQISNPDDALSSPQTIPTTGFQPDNVPIAEINSLGSTTRPPSTTEGEAAQIATSNDGTQIGGGQIASGTPTNSTGMQTTTDAGPSGSTSAATGQSTPVGGGGVSGGSGGGGNALNKAVEGNDAVPDVTAPTLSVEAAVGDENGNIPVVIDATLSGDNPNEVLTVTIGGLPEGATLSAGTLNPDGTYTLTADQLDGLTLTPATDSGEDFNLTVTATATDSVTGVDATTGTQLPVTVVEDETATTPDSIDNVTAPTLSVEATVGDENGIIPVVIDATLSGNNTSEVLTVTVGGLPEGATLSAGTLNPDGTYTLTADQLDGLTLTPATDSGEDFALIVTATATDSESGVNASTDTQLPVTVVEDETAATPDGIANVTAPTLTVEATVGDENTDIPVVIDATLSGDNPNEVLTVTVGGLPAGATLSAGTLNPDGTYTLTADQLEGLTLTPATDSGEDFALTVTATATDSESGVNASTYTQLPVTVVEDETAATPDSIDNVTAPTLSVEATVGDENGDIPVVIDATLSGDNPNEVLTVTVGGLPEGATLSAGTLNPDGTYTLTADQLEGLTLTPATDSGEDFALTVTATATDSQSAVNASTDTQLPVTVVEDGTAASPDSISDVTAPTLAVEATVGDENGNIPVVINATLSGDNPNEVLTITIGGLPEGAMLSAGTLNPDGTYTLTADQLEGLTLTPATDSGEDFNLTVTATATDSESGVAASTDTQLPVTVVEDETAASPDAVANVTAPTLSVEATAGDENTDIPVVIDATLSGDNPNEVLTVTVGGLPAGATLSAGTLNPDGTYTLTADQLEGLTLTPATDSGEDFALTVTATATDSQSGVNASTDTQLPVTVVEDGTAASPDSISDVTAPTLAVEATVGDQNSDIPVVINATLSGDNPNEVLTVTIGGLPDGATLSAGTLNPDGTYTLAADQLDGLTLTPATDSGEDFALTVTATATDSVTGVDASTNSALPVTVVEDETAATPGAIANVTAPTLTVEATVGDENGEIPVVIDAALSGDNPNEVLTITVGGLPEGAMLSAGTLNPDGTYTLAADQLDGLTLTPATDSGEDFNLTVTATATDSETGVNASTDTQLPVTVVEDETVATPDGIANVTAPTLSVEATVGDENGNIPIVIDATLSGDNPNEVLTVTVGGLPEGATLSAGTLNPDGTYTLTADQLEGLTLTPATDSGEDFALTVTATATDSESGVNASTDTQLPVTVVEDETAATPDSIDNVTAPTLSVEATVGDENGNIPVVIDATLSGNNTNEVLTVTIGGLPEGATLSAGTLNPDGTYTLTADQLDGLTLTPATDSGEDFALTVTATATDSETGVNASTDTRLPVTVVEDETATTPDSIDNVTAPTLSVEATVGDENDIIPVVIDATLSGDNPNEVLTVTVGGLPAGATLSAGTLNPDGTYTLTADQLEGLTLTPAADSGEDFSLTVTATATDSETGVNASTDTQLPVTVVEDETAATPDGIANVTAPTLSVEATVGDENGNIPVVIDATLSGDNPNEVLTVTVGGLPEGATLSAGTLNPDGTYTLAADQLDGLSLTPATDSGEDFNLTVTATATDSETGVNASTDTQLPVTVVEGETAATPDGIANVTAPTLSVEATVGDENGEIPVVIDAALSGDNPNEVLTVTVGGLPEGATLSAGTLNPDGTYTLTADQLDGLTLSPATDSGEDFALTVTATATDSETGVAADTGAQLPVTVVEDGTAASPDSISDVTAPTLTVEATVGDENGDIPVVINATLPGDNPNEVLTVTIGGLPNDATLSAGSLNPDGTYTLTADELDGLTLTPATDSGEDFNLTVTATATDSETGVNASTDTQLPVTVVEDETAATPDGIDNVTAPTLSVEATVGDENTDIPVVIDAALSGDNPNEVLTVTVGGLPEGATLSAGTLNPDGTYTLTADQLDGLTLTPATDSGEDFALTVTATATDSETGVNASTDTQLPVTVVEDETAATPDGIANVTAPTLSVEATVGDENGNIPVVIDATLSGDNPNEVLTVTVGGLPEGATLSAGTLNPDGTYTLTADQLDGLTLTPATDSGEDFALTVTATATDSVTGVDATASGALPITVIDNTEIASPGSIANVTAPTLAVEATVGDENGNIPVVIDATLSGDNPNEVLTVTVGGLPEGATLSAGTLNTDGTYTLAADQLDGLTLTPATDSGEDFALAVTATATDSITGIDATASTQLPVTVIDNVETAAPAPIVVPTATVLAAAGLEDGSIALDIQLTVDGLEAPGDTLVVVAGVPDGASLSAGTATPDGAWVLSADQLPSLTLTPADNMSGTIELAVTPLTTGADDAIISGATVPLTVSIAAVADTPVLSVGATSGAEDSPIALTINAALSDLDGSEILSVAVAGVPQGAALSAGSDNADGTWTLTANQLADVTLTPPQDYNGEISLTVTATSMEAGSESTAQTTVVVPVTVTNVLDAPSLTVLPVVGLEDTAIALNIDAGLIDLTPTVSLEVTIDNLPAGATLSAGVLNPDGSYTLTGGELAGLTLTPPQDYNGTTELTVTATASDSLTGLDTTTTAQLPLTVTDVLDAPSLTVLPVVGLEDTAIALNIDAGLVDIAPTTTLEVTVDGLPAGSTLSAGVLNPDGSYTLTGSELAGLTLTPPQDYNGSTELTVTATAIDSLTGSEVTTSAQLPLTVTDVLDAPSLTVLPIVGLEDTAIALNIDAGLIDLTPTVSLEVIIDNLPAGATLSAGIDNGDGTYTLTGDELAGLTLTPAPDWHGDANLGVTAVTHDSLTGANASVSATLPLTVTDVFDAPAAPVPANVTVVSVNDWYNPAWGGGFNATFEMTITDQMIANDSVDGWTLNLTIDNPAATINGGWLDGFNAPVSFDAQSGTFSTVDQNVQLDLVAGDTLRFTVQVQDAGFNFEEFGFVFVDEDAGALATAQDSAPIDETAIQVALAADLEDIGTAAILADTELLEDSTPASEDGGSTAENATEAENSSAHGNSGNNGRGHAYGKIKNGKGDADDDDTSVADILQPVIDLTDAEFLLALESLESPSIDPGTDMSMLDPTATATPDSNPTDEPADATPTAEPLVLEPEPETPIVEVHNPVG